MGTSKDVLLDEISALEKDRNRYKQGFYILHEYFDSIADEEKEEVDKKLKKLRL